MGEHSYAALEARLDAFEKRMEKLETSIDTLITVLQQGEGVVKTLKTVFYIAAPLTALIVWLKDHVKL